MVNNNDWLSKIHYLDFLRDYGRHFSVNRMLTFDSVKTRLDREQPLSFLEFNYMILQAYDFLELYRHHNCSLQAGGSDQWGNIVNGVELIRRLEGGNAFGLTAPLSPPPVGKKWANRKLGPSGSMRRIFPLSNIGSTGAIQKTGTSARFLKFYTDIPVCEINAFDNISGQDINQLKIRLADEATRLAHGEDCLAEIHKSATQVFGAQDLSVDVDGEDLRGNPILKSALPIVPIPEENSKKASLPLPLLFKQDWVTATVKPAAWFVAKDAN